MKIILDENEKKLLSELEMGGDNHPKQILQKNAEGTSFNISFTVVNRAEATLYLNNLIEHIQSRKPVCGVVIDSLMHGSMKDNMNELHQELMNVLVASKKSIKEYDIITNNDNISSHVYVIGDDGKPYEVDIHHALTLREEGRINTIYDDYESCRDACPF